MAPDLKIGDKVLVTEMGAYTTVSATRFNGFIIAPTIIFEDQPEYKKRQVQMTGADNSSVKEAAI